MTAKTTTKSAHVLSASESMVFSALKELPGEFEVQVNPGELVIGYLPVLRYAPDFVVVGPDGRRLIIEVKSPHSLSLSNMANLAHIGRVVQSHGDSFLVLVPSGSNEAESEYRPWRQEPLTLTFVANAEQILSRVLSALSPLPGQAAT